ncbi:putative Fimbrial protein [Burkholderiales bacterium 8X]|nr:putative Fimbrial protein [Burkholderiales bacterium 8X]
MQYDRDDSGFGESRAPDANRRFRTSAFYRAVIGDTNTNYYLRRFTDFDLGMGFRPGWHWPAYFVSLQWMLYRKMWRAAASYVLFQLLIVAMLAVGMWAEWAWLIAVTGIACFIGCHLMPPMLASRQYYHHCRRKIQEARARGVVDPDRAHSLESAGGVSWWGVLPGTLIGWAIPILALSALLDFTNATQLGRQLPAAVQYAKDMAKITGQYYEGNRRFPTKTGHRALTVGLPVPEGVGRVRYDDFDGVITVEMEDALDEHPSFRLVPGVDATGRISYSCENVDIPPRLLPAACVR